MRTSWPATFLAELRRPGCLPYWLARFVTTAGTYWVSDNDRFIGSPFYAPAYGVAKSFGSLKEGISGALAEFNVAEYTLELLRGVPLYLNLLTVTQYLQPAHGWVILHSLVAGTSYRLSFTARDADNTVVLIDAHNGGHYDLSENVNLTPNYSDHVFTFTCTANENLSIFFNTDHIDMINICLATLPGDDIASLVDAGLLDDAQADLFLGLDGISDPPQVVTFGWVRDFGRRTDTVLPIMVQDTTITLERAFIGRKLNQGDYNAALPADYGKVIPIPFGAPPRYPALCAAMPPVAGLYIYIFSDRAVLSVPKVYARNAGKADVEITAYCDRYTGQPSQQYSYQTQGIITISLAQAAQIRALLDISLTDPQHEHSLSNLSLTGGTTNTPQMAEGATSGYQVFSVYGIFNNEAPGNRSAVTMTVTADFNSSFTYDAAIHLCNDSNGRVLQLWAESGISGQRQVSYTFELTSSYLAYNRVEACIGSSNVFIHVELQGAMRTIRLAAAVVDDHLTDVSLSVPAPAGLCDQILVDVVADCGTLESACNYVLTNNGHAAVQVVGSLPVTACNGVIDRYETALYWLNYWAFQAGARYMMPTGMSKLVSRQIGQAARIIAAIPGEGGRRLLTQTRTDLVDVIDKITVLYDRDWTKSRGSDAYNGATAVGGTGVRERPELFMFDFVTSPGDANTLRDLYLNFCKVRHRLIEFDNPIEQADIESGDTVTLGFLDNATGVVIPAEHAPGNMDKADNIKLTVLV